MTVENLTNKVREDGNGSKTAFTFSFEVFDEAELEVYKVVKATGVATLQTITTDYTVSLNTSSPGGTVTYVTAPSALQESFIKRVVPLTQETDIPNVGGIREEQIENQFDRAVMVDQQLQEQIDRCPKLPDTSTLSGLELPTPEASKYLGWNADGDELENKSAPTNVDYTGNISFGLDASKAASPAQGDIYLATDTGKLYLCLGGGTWTWYDPTNMTTRGDMEFYGASGKQRLGAGTSGKFLQSAGSAADLLWAFLTASDLPAGSVVQVIHTPFTTYGTFSSSFPNDDTKPTWAEGAEISGMQTSITPKSSTNRLFIEAMLLFGGSSSGEKVGLAVFQDPSGTDECKAVGVVSIQASYDALPCFVAYEMEAGGTSAITFKFRGGKYTGGGAEYYNGNTSSRFFGGALMSFVRIVEVKA